MTDGIRSFKLKYKRIKLFLILFLGSTKAKNGFKGKSNIEMTKRTMTGIDALKRLDKILNDKNISILVKGEL